MCRVLIRAKNQGKEGIVEAIKFDNERLSIIEKAVSSQFHTEYLEIRHLPAREVFLTLPGSNDCGQLEVELWFPPQCISDGCQPSLQISSPLDVARTAATSIVHPWCRPQNLDFVNISKRMLFLTYIFNDAQSTRRKRPKRVTRCCCEPCFGDATFSGPR